MSKAETTAAVAASMKKATSDAVAIGDTAAVERLGFIGGMMHAGVRRLDGADPSPFKMRGSSVESIMVLANLGKKRHRRGWCSL
jgi:hypothetical protein